MGCYLDPDSGDLLANATHGWHQGILEGCHMNSIVYLVGAVVIMVVALKLIGLY